MWRLLLAFGLVIAIGIALVWWSQGTPMPKKDVTTAAPLSPDEITLREELRADVQTLAGDIGERNMFRYTRLNRAADFIENSLSEAGLKPRRQTYDLNGQACHNIEIEIPGKRSEIVVVGAHYDSVPDCPGANDNGSGVAAMLALARRFAGKTQSCTLRFVAFVNEEPPYFLSSQMGSFVYAQRCKERGDQIVAMISLETIGYFSDAPNSQSYPAPGFGAFYPRTGNFIGFVANVNSRALLQRTMSIFRAQKKIPSQGAALPGFVPGASWSDHWSFWKQGYPAIMITDTAPFRYPHYHLPTDTPDKLDYDRFALVVSGMEKVIADLARD
ncbi:MAG TPA: M28 family peptidase [Chthoniobacterales bacterium]